jgi:putative NIF3 family GTP cyclohydrolase 1 type 2
VDLRSHAEPLEGRPTAADLAAFIARLTDAHRFADEPSMLLVPSEREVRTVGLALEPRVGIAERVDALFLHRPWGLEEAAVPAGVAVLACHLPFDERLTLGYNPELARALGVVEIEVLGTKQGRPLGMIGGFEGGAAELVARVDAEFGGVEAVEDGSGAALGRVAVMGAMTDALVREAAARGAGAYLTGQLRVPARRAVAETGMTVIAVGHRRSEVWGLHLLARLLGREWPGLIAVVLD